MVGWGGTIATSWAPSMGSPSICFWPSSACIHHPFGNCSMYWRMLVEGVLGWPRASWGKQLGEARRGLLINRLQLPYPFLVQPGEERMQLSQFKYRQRGYQPISMAYNQAVGKGYCHNTFAGQQHRKRIDKGSPYGNPPTSCKITSGSVVVLHDKPLTPTNTPFRPFRYCWCLLPLLLHIRCLIRDSLHRISIILEHFIPHVLTKYGVHAGVERDQSLVPSVYQYYW